MTRAAARRAHALSLASICAAAAVAWWTWDLCTRPVRWVGPLTEGPKR